MKTRVKKIFLVTSFFSEFIFWSTEIEEEARFLHSTHTLVHSLSKTSFEVLKYITLLLSVIAEKEEVNKVSVDRLAEAWAPIFFSCAPEAGNSKRAVVTNLPESSPLNSWVKEGDIVEILQEVTSEVLLVKNKHQKTGYCPLKFLKIVNTEKFCIRTTRCLISNQHALFQVPKSIYLLFLTSYVFLFEE